MLTAALCAAALVPAPAFGALSLVGQWGSAGTGNGQFGTPVGIVVANGTVYVTDQRGQGQRPLVQRFDLNGGFLNSWPAPSSPVGGEPFQVSADPAGDIYVVEEPNNMQLEKFGSSGIRITGWNGVGTPSGSFLEPRGVVAGNGSVYVSDYHNRVAKFTPTGAFVSQWGSMGSGPGQFSAPDHMALDAAGNVYVLDRGNSRVEKFDANGAFLTQFGMSNPDGTLNAASVYGASGIAVSPSGFLYVANFYRFEIQKFTTDGQLVTVYPSPQGGVNFRPADLAFDPAGDMFMLTDQRVLKFAESVAATPPTVVPPPVLGRSVTVKAVAGTVLVKPPPGVTLASLEPVSPAASAQANGSGFVPLTQARSIPVGSTLDTTRGTVALTSATAAAGRTQSGQFQSGVFQILQSRAQRGLTELRLTDSNRVCTGAGKASIARRLSSRVLNLLRSNVHGRFQTRGRYSAATVRGTQWQTSDRCDGTLTRVTRGIVIVRDLRLKKNITLRAGKSYLAKP